MARFPVWRTSMGRTYWFNVRDFSFDDEGTPWEYILYEISDDELAAEQEPGDRPTYKDHRQVGRFEVDPRHFHVRDYATKGRVERGPK